MFERDERKRLADPNATIRSLHAETLDIPGSIELALIMACRKELP
jgi:hypothetical protein